MPLRVGASIPLLTLDRRAGVPVSYPVPLAFNWPVFGGIGVVLALLFAAFTIYAVFAAGAREPSERLRLISWAIDGASEEWTLANAWQHMAPGQPVPAEAALLPAELSQRLLDQAAWDNVGGNPTKESVKTALQGAALYCLARDYSGCLKPVVQSAAATQGNSMTCTPTRSPTRRTSCLPRQPTCSAVSHRPDEPTVDLKVLHAKPVLSLPKGSGSWHWRMIF